MPNPFGILDTILTEYGVLQNFEQHSLSFFYESYHSTLSRANQVDYMP